MNIFYKKMKVAIFNFLIFCFPVYIISQISLWKDVNVYGKSVQIGDIINVQVNETFIIDIDSVWGLKKKFELKFIPDRNYLSFLKNADLVKNNNQKEKSKIEIKDKIQVSIAGFITNINGAQYTVTAQKNINIDNKNFTIELTGIFSEKDLKNNIIDSKHIANLNFTILAKPPTSRAVDITLETPTEELQEGDIDSTILNNPEISQEDKNTIIIEYLQEILSVLRN